MTIRGTRRLRSRYAGTEATLAAETMVMLAGAPSRGDKVKDLTGDMGVGTVSETLHTLRCFFVVWDDSERLESIDFSWFSPAGDVWYA